MVTSMANREELRSDIFSMINEKQQMSYNELSGMALSRGIGEPDLKACLSELEKDKKIASRSSGGILTYYLLDQNDIRKVLIVEDDKNINKLMALSIGKGFDISQIYDGGEAIAGIRDSRPDLVILDLMLPHKDGLDICQTIKSDPQISSTIVILVSAMDPTNNRFKGIKYGADYYIKKPFNPSELRNLVTLFLKKKGSRFDALIDLPDEERISQQIETSIEQHSSYIIGTIKIASLADYARKAGERTAVALLRLVSQLLQDAIKDAPQNVFVGFLNSDEFVIAGQKQNVEDVISAVQNEFNAVLPFVMQDAGFKPTLGLDPIFDTKEMPKLALVYTESEKEKLRERRNKIIERKAVSGASTAGSYSYEELQKMFGSEELDIKITRDPKGVRLLVGKSAEAEKEEQEDRYKSA